jgi:hypothetical protein
MSFVRYFYMIILFMNGHHHLQQRGCRYESVNLHYMIDEATAM